MLIVISPAKNLEMGLPLPQGSPSPTQPRLLESSEKLVAAARKLSTRKLMELMDISQDLAELNKERFAQWQPEHTARTAHPAIMVFRGDVYQGLQAENWPAETAQRAQGQLRILSGLYGVLRPLDLIQPYRLEMGRDLKVGRAKSLYEFWKTTPAEILAEDLAALKESAPVLLNLASEEYFKVVRTQALTPGTTVITPAFLDEVKDGFRMMGFFAKRARGLLARWVLEHPEAASEKDLRSFAVEGYKFSEGDSEPGRPVFRRREKDRPAVSLPRATRKTPMAKAKASATKPKAKPKPKAKAKAKAKA